jgi:xylulokinase
MGYLLALDIGTTAVKGVLFDRSGRIRAVQIHEYALDKPAPDIVEIAPERYWQAARTVISALLNESRISPAEVTALGVTSQGETLIVLDANGFPLRPAIVWLDNRSQAEAEALGRDFSLDDVYRITGQQAMLPTWPATRIEWLRGHQSDAYHKARKYLLVEDYVIYRLTGHYVSDRALNPSTLYYDINNGSWWPEMLGRLGISEEQLPELRDSGSIIGNLTPEAARATGLSPATVVTCAPMDQVAAAIGAGNIAPGIVTETTGAALALVATVNRPLYDPEKRVGLYAHGIPGLFALLPWAPTAGMALRWFRDTLGGGDDYDALCEAAGTISPGADGLFLFPHLSGAGCPNVNPSAKGVFWGITLNHTRGHFVRAILEAIAFMVRGNLELLDQLGVERRELRSIGGASRSALWLQIKADVCGTDLVVMDCEEVTGLGTAMLSAVAMEMYPSLAAAREGMVRVSKVVRHNPAASGRYDEIYRRYVAVDRHADQLFR